MKKKNLKIKVDEAFILDVEFLARHALSLAQVGQHKSIPKKEWSALLKKHPEIELRYNANLMQRHLFVAGKLFKEIQDGNFKAMVFYLTHKAGWQKATEIQITDSTQATNELLEELDIKKALGIDPIEAAKTYQKIMLGNK